MTHTQLVLLEIVEFFRALGIVGLGTAVFLGFFLMLSELNDWARRREAKAEARHRAECNAKFWASLAPRSF